MQHWQTNGETLMKAIGYKEAGVADALIEFETAVPELGPHDLLVEINGISVNPVDVPNARHLKAARVAEPRIIADRRWNAGFDRHRQARKTQRRNTHSRTSPTGERTRDRQECARWLSVDRVGAIHPANNDEQCK